MKSEPTGPPMTLGAAAAAGVWLIVWCKACHHQVEPDPAEMAVQYGAETPMLDWRERLVCSRCGRCGGDRNEAMTAKAFEDRQWPDNVGVLLGKSRGRFVG
jgi:hypothetical protein